ncbi:MAG TPA: NADP-dependent malic enzyme [Candidatus Limadaptatus stercoripullorum]|uniref:NADP-dependent malic enzyme n=1 Tax=Candidatus Limadaptatus stercoripullorum TaxID=2840846 RepID=A0A9D1NA39_9FIRM|nr:NADP-dependent malic enzyme [Candidatus Limadaptatus stercoripullorum]
MDYMKESLAKHREWKGKLEVVSRAPVGCAEELSLAYTPGVAAPCLAIKDDPLEAYALTRKWNTVAVVTDGSAVLGLGNIGALAGMPVMEGKCALFKAFAGVDAVPVCLATQDTEEIIATVRNIAPSYGGINLEDISAPRCFEIERRLKAELDIPVFHDDQHGTAVVLSAALINALKVVKKDISTARIVINGAGSAGVAIAEFLLLSGAGDLVVCDKAGVIGDSDEFNPVQRELSRRTNPRGVKGQLSDAVAGADVFIGVSVAGALSEADVRSMARDAVVFAMANPVPEIDPSAAKRAGARVVATGRSDHPNQINNVLAFPGIFRGALDARAKDITDDMQLAAARAIAGLVSDEELSEDYILPRAFDPRIAPAVARAVAAAAE